MGYAGMAMTIGTALGPLLGGVIYEGAGYYAVFGLAYGFIGVDIFLRFILIEKKHAAKWVKPESLPMSSFQTQDSEAVPNVFPGISDDSSSTGDKQSISGTRQSDIQSIFVLLSSGRFLLTAWTYSVVALLLTAFDSVLPLFVRSTFQWQETAQGLIFIPLTIPHMFDPLVGYIIDHYDHTRRYFAAGALFACTPILVLLRLVTENTTAHKVLLCALLTLVGATMTFLLPPLMVEVTFAVQEKEKENPNVFGKGGALALSYGIMNASFAAGSIVGPFFAGFIRHAAGWGTMAWALGFLTEVTAVPVLFFLGGPIWRMSARRIKDRPFH
jgi:MFS family permease